MRVNDLRLRSRYANFAYRKCVRRRHQRDREPSRIQVKQLSQVLHKSRHFRKLVRKYVKKNVPKSFAMHLFTKLSVFHRKLDYIYVRPRSAAEKRTARKKWCTAHRRKKPRTLRRRVKLRCNYTSVIPAYKNVDHRMNHTEFKLYNDVEKNPGPIDHTRTIQAPYWKNGQIGLLCSLCIFCLINTRLPRRRFWGFVTPSFPTNVC